MSSTSYATELEFAVETAWQAGRVTTRYFQTGTEVFSKEDASPVTAADRESEQLMRERIMRYYPQDGVLGEEFGELNAGSKRRWILDPIDGTKSFVHGVPLYGVLLALEEDGEAVLGVLHFPALAETVWAARGAGCWFDGKRARVSNTATVEEALVCATDVEFIEEQGRRAAWDRLRQRARLARTWGDCYGYALVATGRAEIMLDPTLAPWDSAALKPVLEEAGGVFTDWNGVPTHLGAGGIATNAALAGEVRALLGVTGGN
ncbi:MAG: histidinol-phosphatase [Trueperaceae bacterium]